MSGVLNQTLQTVAATVATAAAGAGDESPFVFKTIDYIVFALMLSISAIIGTYFGFFAKGEDTTEEYLMGGRRMKTIPIAISLIASQLSAISIMTIPAEMFSYGINWALNPLSMLLVVPILNYIIIPVFYNNNISNCYEYLEMRFNKATRDLQTFVFTLTLFLMLPIFIFLPSLAFSQVTGYNVHIINIIVCSICVFYTMFGGIKAVVWTDVVQAGIMVVSVILVGVLGAQRVGGLGEILRVAGEGKRLSIDYTFDASTRATLWNAFASGTVMWAGYVGLNQSCVQRIVSLPSLSHARRSLWIFGFGFVLIMFCNCFTGIVMYVRYHDCDPLKSGQVEKPDKMVPYLVQDIVGHITGMPGVFISCVFSAALSTMSASLNSLAGVVYFDYVKPRINHTEQKANMIMKIFVLIMGVYCVFGGFAVAKFNSILQIAYSIGGVSFGSVCGCFLLGMLVPKVHGRPTYIGMLISIVCMAFIVVGAWGRNHYELLPTTTDNCPVPLTNVTTATVTILATAQAVVSDAAATMGSSILDLSFNWYVIVGLLITFIVALPLSYILDPVPGEKLNPKLLSPILHTFYQYELTQTQEEIPELTDIKPKV